MSENDGQARVSAGDEARQRPLRDDLRALADEGLTLAKAEIDLQKARGQFAAGRIKSIALLGALAAILVCMALVALTVGMVIALTPDLGAVGATLAVFAALVLVATACGLMAAGRWKQMVAALTGTKRSPFVTGSETAT